MIAPPEWIFKLTVMFFASGVTLVVFGLMCAIGMVIWSVLK